MKGNIKGTCCISLFFILGRKISHCSTVPLLSKLLPQKKWSVRTKQKKNKKKLLQVRFTSFVETLDWIPFLGTWNLASEEKFQHQNSFVGWVHPKKKAMAHVKGTHWKVSFPSRCGVHFQEKCIQSLIRKSQKKSHGRTFGGLNQPLDAQGFH